MSYTPEPKGVLGLGYVRQLCHPDACAHMELAGPADTIVCVTVRKEISHTITIAYRWWGRVVVCRIVIGCLYASLMWHFTVHSHCLRGALQMDASKLLVTTGHMRILKFNTHGLATMRSSTVKNVTR